MSPLMMDQADSSSSPELATINPERTADIDFKHRLVSEFLARHRYDALLLEKPANFAWFTSGADSSRAGSSETAAGLFITPEARVVITTNVDSTQLFERELPGLGFQLKERPWHEPRHALVDDLCRGRAVAGDRGNGRTKDVSVHLTAMRIPLTALECERIRQVGRLVAHAVEATARHCRRGQTEAEIAGELSHRLIRHRIVPERLQVVADGRGRRYRNWSYGDEPLGQYCTISAVGRKQGLCVGVSRTVAFGEIPAELRGAHQRAMLMQATGMYFSQREWELFETWNRVQRIYEKFGFPDEWQRARQAEIIGYEPAEVPVVPRSEFHLQARMAVYWHPSVGPALGGDSILVSEKGFELLTPMEAWPRVTVKVKGTPIHCPDVLCRPLDGRPGGGDLAQTMADDSILGLFSDDSSEATRHDDSSSSG